MMKHTVEGIYTGRELTLPSACGVQRQTARQHLTLDPFSIGSQETHRVAIPEPIAKHILFQFSCLLLSFLLIWRFLHYAND